MTSISATTRVYGTSPKHILHLRSPGGANWPVKRMKMSSHATHLMASSCHTLASYTWLTFEPFTMFTKPFRIKSNTATKGSERKSVRRSILESYGHLTPADLLLLIPNKCVLTSVRLVTHSGEEVTVYSVDGEPRLFQHEDRIFPTVYTLWILPSFLRHVSTWSPVLTRLQGGADLMLPGVVLPSSGGHSVEGVARGEGVAIELAETRLLVGVAVSLMAHSEMLASGMRGKGFKVLHVLGDQLWALGSKSTPEQPCVLDVLGVGLVQEAVEQLCVADQPPALEGAHREECGDPVPLPKPAAELQEAKEEEDTTEEQCVAESRVSTTLSDDPSCEGTGAPLRAQRVHTEDASDIDDGTLVPAVEVSPVTVMDNLLTECFLQALKTKLAKDDVPMLTSTFYRSHMLDLCPPDVKLEIKQSSYKKLSKFLLEMQKRGIVEIKELSKGVESITKVDFKHPQLKGFTPHLIRADRSHAASSSDTAPSKSLKVTDMFMPSHKLLPLFTACGYGKSSVLDVSTVRDVVTSYIRKEELVSSSNPKMVVLGPVLTDAFYRKGQTPHTQLTWQEVIKCVCNEMRPAYRVYDSEGDTHIRKGKLEPVKLTVALRTGNKKVTLVDNLEMYFISPTELAHTIQKVVAASSTVNSVAGKSSGQQVLVQGNATKAITRLLEVDYGLPTRCIEVIDKIKPSKKKGSK